MPTKRCKYQQNFSTITDDSLGCDKQKGSRPCCCHYLRGRSELTGRSSIPHFLSSQFCWREPPFVASIQTPSLYPPYLIPILSSLPISLSAFELCRTSVGIIVGYKLRSRDCLLANHGFYSLTTVTSLTRKKKHFAIGNIFCQKCKNDVDNHTIFFQYFMYYILSSIFPINHCTSFFFFFCSQSTRVELKTLNRLKRGSIQIKVDKFKLKEL